MTGPSYFGVLLRAVKSAFWSSEKNFWTTSIYLILFWNDEQWSCSVPWNRRWNLMRFSESQNWHNWVNNDNDCIWPAAPSSRNIWSFLQRTNPWLEFYSARLRRTKPFFLLAVVTAASYLEHEKSLTRAIYSIHVCLPLRAVFEIIWLDLSNEAKSSRMANRLLRA